MCNNQGIILLYSITQPCKVESHFDPVVIPDGVQRLVFPELCQARPLGVEQIPLGAACLEPPVMQGVAGQEALLGDQLVHPWREKER